MRKFQVKIYPNQGSPSSRAPPLLPSSAPAAASHGAYQELFPGLQYVVGYFILTPYRSLVVNQVEEVYHHVATAISDRLYGARGAQAPGETELLCTVVPLSFEDLPLTFDEKTNTMSQKLLHARIYMEPPAHVGGKMSMSPTPHIPRVNLRFELHWRQHLGGHEVAHGVMRSPLSQLSQEVFLQWFGRYFATEPGTCQPLVVLFHRDISNSNIRMLIACQWPVHETTIYRTPSPLYLQLCLHTYAEGPHCCSQSHCLPVNLCLPRRDPSQFSNLETLLNLCFAQQTWHVQVINRSIPFSPLHSPFLRVTWSFEVQPPADRPVPSPASQLQMLSTVASEYPYLKVPQGRS